MNAHIIFAALAIVCFLAAALGKDEGKGIPIGLIFVTVMLAL